jgi:hypothetical protein
MYTQKEREFYNVQRENTCQRLGITKNQYNWFRREGNKLHKVYEDYCNGIIEAQEEYEDTTTRFEDCINKKALSLKLYIYFQTDPRGATIYLDKQPIQDNAYTNASCIY